MPAGCDGLWRVLLRSSDHEYDEKLAIEAYWASPGILPTLDKALSSAKDLPEADKKWAYAQLLGLVRAQLALERDPATRTALDGWLKTLENRVEAGK
jgi:hypothetical protein